MAASSATATRRRALREWLAEAEAEHGAISPDAVAQARRAWHDAIADRSSSPSTPVVVTCDPGDLLALTEHLPRVGVLAI